MNSLFEQMGGTYTQQGDYFLPDLKLPPEEERPVGVWGQRRLGVKTVCLLRNRRKLSL